MSPSALFVTTVPITLEAFLVPFAEHFRAHGWRVDALANGATANPHIAETFDARFDAPWSRNPLDPRNFLGTPAEIRRTVVSGGYDIVHVHTPVAAFVTRFALRNLTRAKRPVVIYTAHGFHFYAGQRRLPYAIFRTMERTAARWTDYLVAINHEDLEAARQLGTIDPERVRYVPGIGVDTEPFGDGAVTPEQAAALRRELDLPADAFVLTMIAEFTPVKRHAHVLDALSHTRQPHTVLVLAGDGPLESETREKVLALGLSDRVRFAGYRRDIPALLAASDALVLSSEREGLPRAVLEAMAAGRPVIGTATRGITDAVADTGWIVPKYDPTALAAAIDQAASRPDEVARRGRSARVRAKTEYALPHIITAYEELYHEALASRI